MPNAVFLMFLDYDVPEKRIGADQREQLSLWSPSASVVMDSDRGYPENSKTTTSNRLAHDPILRYKSDAARV